MGTFYLAMAMTKRHFTALAQVLRSADLDHLDRCQLAEDMSERLKDFNPHFDPSRFFEAATGFTRDSWLRDKQQPTPQ